MPVLQLFQPAFDSELLEVRQEKISIRDNGGVAHNRRFTDGKYLLTAIGVNFTRTAITVTFIIHAMCAPGPNAL